MKLMDLPSARPDPDNPPKVPASAAAPATVTTFEVSIDSTLTPRLPLTPLPFFRRTEALVPVSTTVTPILTAAARDFADRPLNAAASAAVTVTSVLVVFAVTMT